MSVVLAPLEFELTRRALIEVTLVGLACGALGVFVVLRGLSFISDALAHCVVPGVVVAHLTRGSIELWGGLAALLAAWSMLALVRRGWLRGDASIAVVFTGAFSLGLALISATGSYVNDLTEILFGDVLGVSELDLWIGAGVASLVLLVLVLLYRPLVLASFDPALARVSGLPAGRLELVVYSLIALAVVAGAIAVGSILVSALLIVPAATARLLVRQVGRQMLLAAILGALAGWIGLYVSYYRPLASGGTIVLAAVLIFLLALTLSPRSGLPAHWRRRTTAAPAAA